MARIISGGLDVDGVRIPVKSRVDRESITPQEPTESWGEYGARNIAKIPTLAYELGRSGAGLGNILSFAQERLPGSSQHAQDILSLISRNFPDALPSGETAQSFQDKLITKEDRNVSDLLRRALLPTTQEAHQEISSLLPSYMTQHRPEDYWAEYALTELPFLAATGGLSSLPAFARGVSRSLGSLGGATLGSTVGGALGDLLGDQEAGQLVGGLAGALGGAKAVPYLANLPSKVLSPRVLAEEKKAFESSKAQRLAETEREFQPRLSQLEKQRQEAYLRAPKQKSAFEAQKKENINAIKQDIKNYNERLSTLDKERAINYKRAQGLEKGLKGDSSGILNKISEVEKDIQHGVSKTDRRLILDNLEKLESMARRGTLTLEGAKRFQKNFNDQIYNRDASNSFKRSMHDVVQELNGFIEQTGGPEHSAAWKQAEAQTRELKQLQRNKNAFIKERENEIRSIHREKFSPEAERSLKLEEGRIKDLLKTTTREYNDIKNAIGKETFESIKSSPDSNKIIEFATSALNKGIFHSIGGGGLAATLAAIFGFPKTTAGLIGATLSKAGKSFYDEIKIARDVMRDHPELYREYGNIIKNYGSMPRASFIQQINNVGQKIEGYATEEQQEKIGPRIKIVSGGMVA